MIKTLIRILLFLNLALTGSVFAQEQHRLFTSILSKYVHHGRVNYKELCKNSDSAKYITFLESSDAGKITNDKDRLAFWINAYNAYTLKIICDHYPVKSINDLNSGGTALGTVFHTTIWDKEIVVINHQNTSLNNIEHKIIRPQFKDFRIHFALVCAAKSCPALRPEAYEGSKLDEQLDDQARLFLADDSKNRFDAANQTASISKIFDWYKKDFGKDEIEVLAAISKFLPDQIHKSIQSAPEKWRVDYTNYDWSLNE